VGAKINGRIAPLNTKLNNGDQIDIITAKNQTPSPTWERFVVTGKARSHIRRFVRQQQRDQYSALGKAMLQKIFQQEGYEFTDKAVVANGVAQFRCRGNGRCLCGDRAGQSRCPRCFQGISSRQ
jgi:guanosine-3',5'-bis(diphosphate) 3'-pyrophosphohydrolase